MITVDQLKRSIHTNQFPMATKIVVENDNMTFSSEKMDHAEFFLKYPIENLSTTIDEDEPQAIRAIHVQESRSGKEFIFTLADHNYLKIPKSNIVGTFYHTLAQDEVSKEG